MRCFGTALGPISLATFGLDPRRSALLIGYIDGQRFVVSGDYRC